MSQDMEDPFAVAVDEDDPFASEEDFGRNSGPFVPWPGIEDVAGRLVVLVPRKHDAEAKVSEYLQNTYNLPATREEWIVDVVVLDGEVPFSFSYRGKEDKDSTEYVEKVFTVESLPFLVPGWKVSWGNVIGAINKIAGGTKPMGIGHLRAGYNAKDMRSGKTFEMFEAEYSAWEEKVKKNPKAAGAAPRQVWHFVPSGDAGDKAKAVAWWKQAKAEGFSI